VERGLEAQRATSVRGDVEAGGYSLAFQGFLTGEAPANPVQDRHVPGSPLGAELSFGGELEVLYIVVHE
jgi:hypothetical protein